MKKILLIGISIVTAVIVGGCEESEDNKISQAQECLDDARVPADADACVAMIDGIDNVKANRIRCALAILGDGELTQDDIVTVGRDGRDWRDVTNDDPFDRYIRWAPNGRQLVFNSDRGEGGNIWLADADGGNLKQITFPHEGFPGFGFPIYSPMGDRLVISRRGQPFELDLSKPWSGDNPQIIDLDPSVTGFTTWDWSPDGKMLAGIAAVGTRRFIGIYSFETRTFTKFNEGAELLPSWLPDSRHLIYSNDHEVYRLDVTSGKTELIFENRTVQIRSPFVSADGKLLYYTAGDRQSDIWMLELSDKR